MRIAYRAVLFDLDGTLSDTSPGILRSVRHALRAMGAAEPEPAALYRFIGPPLWQSFAELCGMDAAQSERAVQLYRERYSTVGVHEASLYPGIRELLDALKRGGALLATASAKPERFVREVLRDQDAERYFDAVVGSELDGRRSDKRELIEEALHRLGDVPPGEAVMVGDRCFDLDGARRAGLDFIGVLFGFGSAGEFTGYARARLAQTPQEVFRLCEIRPE